MTTATSQSDPAPVPVLPRASEVRETVAAIERGLEFLRGLGAALERVERSAADTVEGVLPDTRPDGLPPGVRKG